MTSGLSIDAVKIIQDAPGIARASNAPLLTPEAVLMAPIPLRSTGTDANVELRGVSPNVFAIRRNITIIEGRMFTPGIAELVVGKNAKATYSGLTLGNSITLGTVRWQVVGVSTRAVVPLTPKSGATPTFLTAPIIARTLFLNP